MIQTLFQNPKAKPITLRPYQAEAIAAVYNHLRQRDDNPCVVIPTAGGKTSQFRRRLRRRSTWPMTGRWRRPN